MHTWECWPKHFLYISPSKIDALYGQIDRRRVSRIAATLKIRIAILEAELRGTPADETVYSRLKVVLQSLAEQEWIGSIGQPASYFAARLPMKWGPYGMTQDEQLVWFGAIDNGTALGLGGSLHNVVGQVGRSYAHSHSATFAMLRELRRELEAGARTAAGVTGEEDDEALALLAIELASTQMEGPLQDIEFVAKRLLWGEGDEMEHVLLGTPLYVAAAD